MVALILLRRCSAAVETWQVELHGKYSLSRIADFHSYDRACSRWRVALLYITTPVSCLAFVMLQDLIPLRPPQDGLDGNRILFLRVWLEVMIISIATLVQLRNHFPQLPMSARAFWAIALWSTSVNMMVHFSLSSFIGFPLPFTPVFSGTAWAVAFVLGCWCLWHQEISRDRSVRAGLLMYLGVFSAMVSLILVYPAYFYVYNNLKNERARDGFVVALSLLKIVMRNWMHYFMRNDDFGSELLVFNVEVFHTFYVSCSLQQSTSTNAYGVVMVLDLVQAVISILDIRHCYTQLQTLMARIDPTSLDNFVDISQQLLQDSHVRNHRLHTASLKPTLASFARVHPTAEIYGRRRRLKAGRPSSRDLTLDERVEFVHLSCRLLFLTEFLVLVEYIEVIMPVVYAVYMVAMASLPNRQFYQRLADMPINELHRATINVLIYAGMELVTFLLFAWLVGRWLRISLFRQVAFVLEKQASGVQTKLVLWVSFAAQCTLQHFGYDFSMQFTWLQKQA